MTILDATRIVSFGLVVLIGLVQFIIYPSFAEIAADRFVDWHSRYTQLITWFVGPLMIGQAGLLGWMLVVHPSRVVILATLLVSVVWLTTAWLSVQCHNQLQSRGLDPQVVERLVRTNWTRTIAWTLAFLLLLIAT